MNISIPFACDVEVPRVPNFLRIPKTDGTVSVAHLDDESLRKVGAAWTEALLKRANEIRYAPKAKP